MIVAVVTLAALALLLGTLLGFAIHGWVSALGAEYTAEHAQDKAQEVMRAETVRADDALAAAQKATEEMKLSQAALNSANTTIDRLQTEAAKYLKEKIDASNGDDLVAVSRDVFGVHSSVPRPDPTPGPAGTPDHGGPDAVPSA